MGVYYVARPLKLWDAMLHTSQEVLVQIDNCYAYTLYNGLLVKLFSWSYGLTLLISYVYFLNLKSNNNLYNCKWNFLIYALLIDIIVYFNLYNHLSLTKGQLGLISKIQSVGWVLNRLIFIALLYTISYDPGLNFHSFEMLGTWCIK